MKTSKKLSHLRHDIVGDNIHTVSLCLWAPEKKKQLLKQCGLLDRIQE